MLSAWWPMHYNNGRYLLFTSYYMAKMRTLWLGRLDGLRKLLPFTDSFLVLSPDPDVVRLGSAEVRHFVRCWSHTYVGNGLPFLYAACKTMKKDVLSMPYYCWLVWGGRFETGCLCIFMKVDLLLGAVIGANLLFTKSRPNVLTINLTMNQQKAQTIKILVPKAQMCHVLSVQLCSYLHVSGWRSR